MSMAWKPLRLVLCCHAVLLALWLGVNTGLYLYDQGCETLTLYPDAAALHELEPLAPGVYASTGGDPQLVFAGLDARVRTLRLEAAFETPPGEMDLYYTRGEGQGFTPARRAWGYLQEDESYLYTLAPGRVWDLRIDPGTLAGNRIELRAVTLNPRRPLVEYLLPSFGNLVAWVLLASLAAAAIYTIMELVFYFQARKSEEAK